MLGGGKLTMKGWRVQRSCVSSPRGLLADHARRTHVCFAVLTGHSGVTGKPHGLGARWMEQEPWVHTLKYLGLSVHRMNEGNPCGWWWVRAHSNCKVLLGCYDESHARHIKEVLGPMTCSSCICSGVLCLLLWARQRWDPTAHVHRSVPKDTPAAWQRGFSL